MSGRPIGMEQQAPLACLPYDPRAPEVASTVTGMIHQHLPHVLVEHIGSTAVQGCVGKGVIDLLIPYREGELEPIKETLQELGFQRQSRRDPFPEDRPMRVGSIRYDGDTFRLHVHVVPASSGEPDELRAFRDRLRNDPEMMEAYVRRKREIIQGGTTDAIDYSIIKGAFVQEALEEMNR
ncbi:MAG TPA: GrpB family protein [Rubrobacter sp.]|nr:GrpB family protein [Rubrobacter sp.]